MSSRLLRRRKAILREVDLVWRELPAIGLKPDEDLAANNQRAQHLSIEHLQLQCVQAASLRMQHIQT